MVTQSARPGRPQHTLLKEEQEYVVATKYKSPDTQMLKYRQVSNIRRTLVGNKIVDNSDVVGASPVGAAPTTSPLST